MSLVLRCGWPEDEDEGGEEEVDDEGDELAVVGSLDEGLPLGLQQVDHDALDQVEVLHLLPEHDQVQGGHQVDLARRGVDGVELLDGVGRAADRADLPVDLPLHGDDVEEHVHVRQVGGHLEKINQLI